tara:strand:- start:25012 stop:26055 length:1044 start_codon:yes stop_codon:yes gene_type:complete
MSTSLFAPDPNAGTGTHPRSGEDIQFLGNNLQLAAIPVITFYFSTAKGFAASELPNSITMHLPGAGISISSLQNFSTEENIAGAGIAGTITTPDDLKSIGELIGGIGQTVTSSIVRTVLDALVGTAGFATSAGGAGISQVEFLLRQTFNQFQQLIYKGPTHRVFQLPFSMKPSSPQEAEDVRDIVLAFRMASSPSISDFDMGKESRPMFDREADSGEMQRVIDEGGELSQQQQLQISVENDQGIADSARDLGLIGPEPFLFNYPDMTQFALDLYVPSSDRLIRLFESEFCVMTAMNVDYGESKLNFFKESNGKYYPTETTLSLSLTEHIHYFKETAIRSHDKGYTIL